MGLEYCCIRLKGPGCSRISLLSLMSDNPNDVMKIYCSSNSSTDLRE